MGCRWDPDPAPDVYMCGIWDESQNWFKVGGRRLTGLPAVGVSHPSPPSRRRGNDHGHHCVTLRIACTCVRMILDSNSTCSYVRVVLKLTHHFSSCLFQGCGANSITTRLASLSGFGLQSMVFAGSGTCVPMATRKANQWRTAEPSCCSNADINAYDNASLSTPSNVREFCRTLVNCSIANGRAAAARFPFIYVDPPRYADAKNCSWPSEYQFAASTATTDTVCRNVSVCAGTTHPMVSQPPTRTSDRRCVAPPHAVECKRGNVTQFEAVNGSPSFVEATAALQRANGIWNLVVAGSPMMASAVDGDAIINCSARPGGLDLADVEFNSTACGSTTRENCSDMALFYNEQKTLSCVHMRAENVSNSTIGDCRGFCKPDQLTITFPIANVNPRLTPYVNYGTCGPNPPCGYWYYQTKEAQCCSQDDFNKWATSHSYPVPVSAFCKTPVPCSNLSVAMPVTVIEAPTCRPITNCSGKYTTVTPPTKTSDAVCELRAQAGESPASQTSLDVLTGLGAALLIGAISTMVWYVGYRTPKRPLLFASGPVDDSVVLSLSPDPNLPLPAIAGRSGGPHADFSTETKLIKNMEADRSRFKAAKEALVVVKLPVPPQLQAELNSKKKAIVAAQTALREKKRQADVVDPKLEWKTVDESFEGWWPTKAQRKALAASIKTSGESERWWTATDSYDGNWKKRFCTRTNSIGMQSASHRFYAALSEAPDLHGVSTKSIYHEVQREYGKGKHLGIARGIALTERYGGTYAAGNKDDPLNANILAQSEGWEGAWKGKVSQAYQVLAKRHRKQQIYVVSVRGGPACEWEREELATVFCDTLKEEHAENEFILKCFDTYDDYDVWLKTTYSSGNSLPFQRATSTRKKALPNTEIPNLAYRLLEAGSGHDGDVSYATA